MDKALIRRLADRAATYIKGNSVVNNYINNKLYGMICDSIENYLSTYWNWNESMQVCVEIPLDFSVAGVVAFEDLLSVIRNTYGCAIRSCDEVIDYHNHSGKLVVDIAWTDRFRDAFLRTMNDGTSDVDYFDVFNV